MDKKEWEEIEDNFGGLFVKIAQNISGDPAIGFEDCLQEIKLHAIKIIEYFKETRSEGLPFRDFIYTIHFRKYFKTCLWNKKNTIGSNIKKKYSINSCASLDETLKSFRSENALETTELNVTYTSDLDKLLSIKQYPWTQDEKEVLRVIQTDPDILTESTGTVCVAKLAKKLNSSKPKINHLLNRIKKTLQKNNLTE